MKLLRYIQKNIYKVLGLNYVFPEDIIKGGGKIGEGNYFSFFSQSIIDPGRLSKIEIGDRNVFSKINIFAHDYSWSILSEYSGEMIPDFGSKVSIGSNNFFGFDVVVLPGVKIGSNNIIAARSVISKDIPCGEIWAGVPARKIGTITELIYKKKEQVEYNFKELLNNGKFNKENSGFLAFYFVERTEQNYKKYIRHLKFKSEIDSNIVKEYFFNSKPLWNGYEEMYKELTEI